MKWIAVSGNWYHCEGDQADIFFIPCGNDVRMVSSVPFSFCFVFPARKQEIIKLTEQLIEAINNGDFEAYA